MNRPHVVINCAMSADGKIASPLRKQIRISSEEDIARVYRLRNESDAVLVGIGTILADDPKLTVKETYVPHPHQPLRVILDGKGRTPASALALNTTTHTLILTRKGYARTYDGPHIEVVECGTGADGLLDLTEVLDILCRKGIRTLLVEGGGSVIWSFLKQKLVDDLYIYVGSCIIGGKDTPTVADGEGIVPGETITLTLVEVTTIGDGVLIHYQLP